MKAFGAVFALALMSLSSMPNSALAQSLVRYLKDNQTILRA